MNDFLTIGKAAEAISAEYGFDLPVWKLRKIVDEMRLDMPRVACYRMIAKQHFPAIVEELQRRDWPPARNARVHAEAAQ